MFWTLTLFDEYLCTESMEYCEINFFEKRYFSAFEQGIYRAK